MAERPNILLIVLDQFRADLLDGALGDAVPLPNLRRFADGAVMFRRHFSVTTPCGPSRASLLTGQYAMNHRSVRNGTPLRHDTPNLARELRAAGYDPLLFGYTDTTQDPRAHAPDDPRLRSYEEALPGFTEVLRMRQESDDRPWRDHLRAKGYEVPDGMDLYRPRGARIDDPALYRAEDSDTAFLTDRFLAHMQEAAPGWAAMLAYVRPHPPFVAPEPYNRLIDRAAIPEPAATGDADPHPYLAAAREARPVSDTVKGFPGLDATPDTVRTIRALYLGLAAEVDHHLGRIFDWLAASGRMEDTLVVVTADHGEMLGDHGLWGKNTYHDAAFHVPLLIHAPGTGARRIEGMTESIDVTPTILDWIGRDRPASMDGQSLLPLLRTGAGARAVAFSEHDFGNPIVPDAAQAALGLSAEAANLAVLRTGRHRLVQFAACLPQVLFDMNDAGETLNLAEHPDAAGICLDLSRQMLCHRMQNPEGTFARTMVTQDGVRTGPG